MQDRPFASRAQLDRRMDAARQLRSETLGLMLKSVWRAGRVSPGDLLRLARRVAALDGPRRIRTP